MSRHSRRRPRKSETAAAIPVRDSDLLAAWPSRNAHGRFILETLQAARGRDHGRGGVKPPPPTSSLYDPETEL